MKIYRTETICDDAKIICVARDIAQNCGGYVSISGDAHNRRYSVLKRCEYLRDWHLEGKALLKMLPAWAKHRPPKSIGDKVAAFYAINNKVITDMSEPWIGSEEWHEAQELLPDPFRSCRQYRESIGELRA